MRRVDSISTNFADQLASKIKKFDYFSICLDESPDVVVQRKCLFSLGDRLRFQCD